MRMILSAATFWVLIASQLVAQDAPVLAPIKNRMRSFQEKNDLAGSVTLIARERPER